MKLRHHRPRSFFALVVLSCVAMIVIAIPSVFRVALPSAAADPTVVIDPSSELVHGQTINVTITSDRSWSGGRFFGVSICGNADSSGRPLRVRDVNDCVGAEVGVPTGSNGLNSVSDSGQGISGATGGGGITAGRTYTTTVGAKRTAIGRNNATCVAKTAGVILDCTVSVAVSTTAGQVPIASGGWTTDVPISFYVKPNAGASVASITGVNGSKSAMVPGTSTVTFSGTNWRTGQTIKAELCDGVGLNCSTSLLSGTLRTAASGGDFVAGSNSLSLASSATAGSRILRLSDGLIDSVDIPLTVLGTRTVIAVPQVVGLNSETTLTGESFTPLTSIVVSQWKEAARFGAQVVVTSDSAGKFTVKMRFTDVAVMGFAAAERNPADLSEIVATRVIAPVTFQAAQCQSFGANGCDLSQTVTFDIPNNGLKVSQDTTTQVSGSIDIDSSRSTVLQLQEITIADRRGSLAGWSINATISNLVNSTNSRFSIPAANITVVPRCQPLNDFNGRSDDISANSERNLSTVQPVSLCNARAGGGGGVFKVQAELHVALIGSVLRGTYGGVLTLVIV